MKTSLAKKCTLCNKTKKAHLFSKGNTKGGHVWCKACFKKYRRDHKAKMKEEDFLKWKSQQYRTNWRRRAKNLGFDPNIDVPTAKEIRQWLDTQQPFTCYFTGDALGRDFGTDHIIPTARGGSFGLDNLCITSTRLNSAKGTMTGKEFKDLLKLIGKWDDNGTELLTRLVASNAMFKGIKQGKRR